MQSVRIDLGCGDAKREGYLGLDLYPGANVDFVLDLTRDRYPFEDGTVDAVFSAHFLEHIEEPNHVFSEIGRVCSDGARIEFYTPYAWTNDAWLYGHLHGITEEMWSHFGVSHRDVYAGMLGGRWLLQRFVFVIEPATVADLESRRVPLDFAVRYYQNVVKELGVEIEFRRDLSAPVTMPERVYATTRFGSCLPLAGKPAAIGSDRTPSGFGRVLAALKRRL